MSKAKKSVKPTAARRASQPAIFDRLGSLPSGVWTAIVGGAVVLGFIAILISANNRPATSTSTPAVGSQNTGVSGPGVATTAPQAVGTYDDTIQPLAVGTTAPAFSNLLGTDGKRHSLADYKGKVILLEFFAPWCPHCQAMTTTLEKVQTTLSSSAQVLSVSASPYGRNYEKGDTSPITMSDVMWFASNFHLSYPALFDPTLATVNSYGLQGGFPTFYVINKQGAITYVQSGDVTYEQFQQQIAQANNS